MRATVRSAVSAWHVSVPWLIASETEIRPRSCLPASIANRTLGPCRGAIIGPVPQSAWGDPRMPCAAGPLADSVWLSRGARPAKPADRLKELGRGTGATWHDRLSPPRRGELEAGAPPGSLGRSRRSLAVEGGESQDREADAAQKERDANHGPEKADPVGRVGQVERRGERGLGHPDVPLLVRLRLAGLRVDRGELRVRGAAARLELRLRGPRLRLVLAHLRVHVPAGCLERVDAHVLGEAPCPRPAVDGLVCDAARWQVDARQPRVLDLLGDRGRGHVGGADDLLLLEVVGYGRATVQRQDYRDHPERDQHRTGGESTPLEDARDPVASPPGPAARRLR